MRRPIAIMTMAFVGAATHAAEIYHWVDADGVTHYSQWAPSADVDDVETVAIEAAAAPGYDPLKDPYSIANQVQRIHAMWLDIEAIARARRDRDTGADAADDGAEDDDYRHSPYLPHLARPWLPDRPGAQRRARQQRVEDEFRRLGARPAHSINSSTHRRRVELKKQALQSVGRQPAESRHSSNR